MLSVDRRWTLFVATGLLLCKSNAFSARLTRPWETVGASCTSRPLSARLKLVILAEMTDNEYSMENNDESTSPPVEDIDSFPLQPEDEMSRREIDVKKDIRSSTIRNQELSVQTVLPHPSDAATDMSSSTASSWRSTARTLFRMTRPSNIPGVILLHALGVYLAVPKSLWKDTLLLQPQMWLILASLLLTASTSMVINDYYDARLGVDNTTLSTSWTRQVTFLQVRRCLSVLYAMALLGMTLVDCLPARLAILTGLLLTYTYTKYWKPKTWWKNMVCASLLALSPLTSAAAAAAAVVVPTAGSAFQFQNGPLWRLIGSLFFGFFAREMTMDLNDFDDDQRQGVQTVPVVYGNKFASRSALGLTMTSAAMVWMGPLLQLCSTKTTTMTIFRRMVLASLSGVAMIFRAWQVLHSEGQDQQIVESAVEEGKWTILFLLASFV